MQVFSISSEGWGLYGAERELNKSQWNYCVIIADEWIFYCAVWMDVYAPMWDISLHVILYTCTQFEFDDSVIIFLKLPCKTIWFSVRSALQRQFVDGTFSMASPFVALITLFHFSYFCRMILEKSPNARRLNGVTIQLHLFCLRVYVVLAKIY